MASSRQDDHNNPTVVDSDELPDFRALLKLELVGEWKKFAVFELVAIAVAAVLYFANRTPEDLEWYKDPHFYLDEVLLTAVNMAFHITSGFFMVLGRINEELVRAFAAERRRLRSDSDRLQTIISDTARRPTALPNEALQTLCKFLGDASQLYSVVYVRPGLWLRSGDLMNVFTLQAYFNRLRSAQADGRELDMVRFLIWDEEEFSSPEGLFIIRASILVGARTKILSREILRRAVRAEGDPLLVRLVREELHVWLDRTMTAGGKERLQGRYGRVSEKGFEPPLPMNSREDEVSPKIFLKLVELLEQQALEVSITGIDEIEEAALETQVSALVRRMGAR